MPRFPISLLYEDAPPGAKSNPYKVPNAKELQQLARKVAQGEKLQGAIDIVFCSDEKVRALNKAYRKLDKVTDVLSFEWHEEDFAGEVFIATAQTERQAPRFNNNYANELRRVVVHGVLHLCGYDHMKTGERNIMRAKEDFYLGAYLGDKAPASETVAVKSSARAVKTAQTKSPIRMNSTKANSPSKPVKKSSKAPTKAPTKAPAKPTAKRPVR